MDTKRQAERDEMLYRQELCSVYNDRRDDNMDRVLMLKYNTDRDGSWVWQTLGCDAGVYNDNGWEPDGDSWLPSVPGPVQGQDEIIAAGYGRMVYARYFRNSDLEELADFIGRPDLLGDALCNDEDAWYASVADWCQEQGRRWAHYGAYLADNEVWVITEPLD